MVRVRLTALVTAILLAAAFLTSSSIVGAAPVSPASVGGCPAGPCPTANGPLIGISKTASPTSLPAVGGNVTYTYTVTNGGNVPLSGVTVTNNGLTGNLAGGHMNGNGLLDLTETWTYTCTTTVTVTTTNTATAQGTGTSGIGTSATATATVTVGCSPLVGANCTPPPTCPPGTPNCPTPTPCLPGTGPNCPPPTPTPTPCLAALAPCPSPTPTPSPTPCPPTVPNCQPVPATICVLKFDDLNGNGYKAATEPPLAGVTFTITPAVVPAQTTPTSGQVCWTLGAGSYTVTESGPLTTGAWVPTTPALAPSRSQTVTVAAGQTVHLLFGDHEFLINHFECYTVSPTSLTAPFVGIGLRDQFGTRTAAAISRTALCNPAQKGYAGSTSPILNPAAHLVCYRAAIRLPTLTASIATVLVNNQFGPDELRVVAPTSLCLPSSKSLIDQYLPIPTNLSHYLCYAVTDLTPGKHHVVALADEFGKRVAAALTPVALCNPVLKTFGGSTSRLVNAVDHLVCYTIATTPFKERTVWINNQFERVPLTALKPIQLCVPSTKRVLPTLLRVP